MAIPTPIIDSIVDNEFVYKLSNPYTNTPAYVRRARDVQAPDRRWFVNNSLLIEVEYDNFIAFRFMGYTRNYGFLRDTTRIFRPGIKQVIPVLYIDDAIQRLQNSAYLFRSEYAL